MTIDGDILEIELDYELNDVIELKNFVQTRLKYIEEIVIIGEKDNFASSALLQLLVSMKKSKPSIKIPLLDEGKLELKEFGSLNWINNG